MFTFRKTFVLAALLQVLIISLQAEVRPRPFDRTRDTFAFANDTFWSYEVEPGGKMEIHKRDQAPPYTRHCLVMTRGVLQFRKFAVFDPSAPKASAEQYRQLVRKLARIPVWSHRKEKILIPGYADLRSFSAAHSGLLQKELGLWWPTYWRIGNWKMACRFPRERQRRLAEEVARDIGRGEIPALFLTRFHPLNHVVLPYKVLHETQGDLLFFCYDPNDKDAPVILRFEKKTSSFYWPKTGYWPGGRVNAFRTYQSILR